MSAHVNIQNVNVSTYLQALLKAEREATGSLGADTLGQTCARVRSGGAAAGRQASFLAGSAIRH